MNATALQNADDDGVVQRIVPAHAADSSPLHSAAASSVFQWRGAGTAAAAPEPTAAPSPQPPEEKPMVTATKKRAARKSSAGSPQLQICTALLQGDLTRQALAEACSDLTPQQLASALNNAKSHGRIAWIEKDGVLRLSKAGKEWVAASGGDVPVDEVPPTRKAGKRKTAHRRARVKQVKVDTSPTDTEPTFRCAVISDGGFWLSKAGADIELTREEHQEMLRYQERMAEVDA